jgi:flavin-dependent dehydrogenase
MRPWRTCDVLVVGAGPAGAACALALARRGLRTQLLDAPAGRRPSPGESLHGVAASSLGELGLWPAFLEQAFRRSYLAEIAWESALLRERHAIDHVWGPEFHLDRGGFDAWLCHEAVRGGVERVRCIRLEHVVFDWTAERFQCLVRTESGTITIGSHALVDATGRAAAVLRRLGGRISTDGDHLIAVSRTYEQPFSRPSVLIEAVDNGWWYSAPLPGNRSLAIWFTDAERARGQASRPEYFDAALRASLHTRARFAAIPPMARATSTTRTAPLSICAARPTLTTFDTRLPALPVGDAATAFDPISGDGLCFALRSGLDAAEALVQFRAGRRDAIAIYASGVESVFTRHVTRRAALYAAVAATRFGDAPFWSRVGSSRKESIPVQRAVFRYAT